MCEDRSLSIKRGGVRESRIRSIRMRMRQNALLARRFGESPPNVEPSNAASAAPGFLQPPGVDPSVERANAAERIFAGHPVYVPHRPLCQGLCCEAERRRRREGLLDIALRTVILMRNNRELQRRLHALQAETRDFIKAMTDRQNSENQTQSPLTPEMQTDNKREVE